MGHFIKEAHAFLRADSLLSPWPMICHQMTYHGLTWYQMTCHRVSRHRFLIINNTCNLNILNIIFLFSLLFNDTSSYDKSFTVTSLAYVLSSRATS